MATHESEVAMTGEDPRETETFGQRIKRRRRELGLTQRQVAEMLQIDFTYLSKLENDRGEPPGEKTIRKLSVELQEDEEELLALAGKVPEQLRDRAQQDVAFARLVRRLPDLPDSQLQDIYRSLNINRPKS
jgi:transcriptional regulator with XRE-family HTH domain